MNKRYMGIIGNRRILALVQYALSILAGGLMGLLFLLDLPLKWMIALIIAIGLIAILIIVRNTKRALLFILTFIIPFYIGTGLPSFLARISPTGRISEISIQVIDILLLAILIYRLAQFSTRRAEIRFYSSTTVPALAWLIASALSLANARDTGLAAIELIKMGRLVLFYFIVANSLEDEADVKWVIWALLLGILIEGLLGSYQAIAKQPLGLSFLGEESGILQLTMGRTVAYRAYGTIGHGNSYAMYLSATMSFALAFLFSGVRRLYRIFAGIVLCVGTIGLVFSLSRGGWICFCVVFIVILIFTLHKRHANIYVAWVLGAVIVLLVLLSLILSQQNLIISRLTSDDHGAAIARIKLAEGAMAMIQDYPVLGVGLNHYLFFMPRYDMTSYAIEGLTVVHNIFLLIASETGLIGLTTFMWFLATLIVQSWRVACLAQNDIIWVAGVGIFAAYTSMIIHGMVDYAMLANEPLFRLFWLFAAIATSLRANVMCES